jgi:signal transduction histidine kinase
MRGRKNILIIDDSDDDRELYRDFLKRDEIIDWTIFEADNGEAGLRIFQSENIHLVLLDYSLPGRSGLKLLDHLKGQNLYAPAVLLTGNGSETIAIECMKSGAQDYLAKSDITTDAFRRTIHNALERVGMLQKIDMQRESLKSFAHVLAHDLKAPIGRIVSISDLIGRAIADNDHYRINMFFDQVRKSSVHLRELIDTLSQYNELDGGGVLFEPVAMGVVLAEVLDQLSDTIERRGARVTFDDLPRITGNAPRLAQLLQNLIANGIKYCEAEVPSIHVGARELPEVWQFSIRDNGIGIAPEFHQRIFKPFERLHGSDRYMGTGLGLAICKRIVDSHNGRIWCESEQGNETTFYFTLPKERPADAPTEDAARASSAVAP